MKETFLHFLANEYVKRGDLSEYCFVFPNRRAGKFFAKELEECGNGVFLLPEITTINTLVSELTDSIEANRIESLMMLYKAYKTVLGDHGVSFDRFARWGDVLLSDFGDADRYMVDVEKLFVNISNAKEIKANYLTPEVKKIISHFFNIQYDPVASESEDFWKHIVHTDGEVSVRENFTSIWSQLWNIYQEYSKLLKEAGLTYNGRMYRDAVEKVKNMRAEDFDYKRYVFVGFNVLSKSEYSLFKNMKEKGIGEFHWDYNSPAFDTCYNKGTKFLSEYVKEFKPPFEMPKDDTFPANVFAIGIASNYAQARYADAVVKQLVEQGKTDRNNAIDTAIVLPDEQLFMPVMKAIGVDTVEKVNVTMGLSIRNSSIATLMSTLSKMHYQATKSNDVWTYFHADVKDVLLHPLVKFYDHSDSLKLINKINHDGLFQVPYDIIAEGAPKLARLFTVVKDFTAEEVSEYVGGVLSFAEEVLKSQQRLDKELDDEEHTNTVANIELAFLSYYTDALNQLREALSEPSLHGAGEKFDVGTFCYLIDRLVSATKVPFEGEPLGGLQVMGLLETRCIDFKNVIILSMNERIFPRKHFTKSFVPQNMRKAYDMSTIEHQESMYAYYFYRLISRAENVYMIYDSRTQGASSGEESRYISQLETLFGDKCHVKRLMPKIGLESPLKVPIVVEKDDRVMGILEKYKTPLPKDANKVEEMVKSGNLKLLSAHSINVYIDCPLHFYLHYVEGLAEIEDVSAFMEASTFGTIIHETIQQLYPDGTQITTQFIDNLLDRKNKQIDNTIIKTVNREFLHKGDNCFEPLYGEALLKFDIMKTLIVRILNFDKKLIAEKTGGTPIEYIQGEKKLLCSLSLGNNTINLTYIIDRLDRMTYCGEDVVRIVDYKTGGDSVSVGSVGDLFNPSKKDRCHAILQLLLYCKALSTEPEYEGKTIMPVIYKLREIEKSGVICEKKQVKYPDNAGVNEQFLRELTKKMDELFSKDVPFRQAANEENCKYCKFKDFCRVE